MRLFGAWALLISNFMIWSCFSKASVNIVTYYLNRMLCVNYRDTVSNKKTHLAVFKTCVFSRISPEPLELQKSYLHLFTSLFKELSDENDFFPIQSQNQLIFLKTLFCQKKSKILERIRHFEKFKNFFSWI